MKKVLTMLLVVVMGTGLCQAQNRVSNPGFETGDFTDWFSGGSAMVIWGDNGPSAFGEYSAYMDNTPNGDTRSIAIAVTPGETLTFGVDWKTTPDATGDVRAQVRWHTGQDAGRNAIGWIGESNFLLGNTGGLWSVFSNNVAVIPGANYCDIRISANVFEPFTGSSLIDNVQLVPEPATLVLLSIGGLLLRKRS